MAEPPKGNQAANNFPGYEYLDTLYTSWNNALHSNSDALNGAWNLARSGRFQFGDWAKTWADLWESTTKAALDSLALPAAPQWQILAVERSPAAGKEPALDWVIPVRRQDLSAQPTATALHAFGGPGSLGAVASVRLEGRQDQLRYSFAEPDKVRASAAGDYIGFVYDASPPPNRPPLLIVLLRLQD
jgi:hypothetical protein